MKQHIIRSLKKFDLNPYSISKRLLAIIGMLTLGLPALSCAYADKMDPTAIQISTYEVEGTKHVFAKTLVEFTPDYFLNLVSFSNENCAWLDKCESVIVLRHPDASALDNKNPLIQTHINTPWPFKDRDMVVTSRTEYDEASDTLVIIIEDASELIPEHKNRVRMTQVYGQWRIKPYAFGPKHLFQLCYSGSANANGNIPDIFAQRFLTNSTRKTFENLKALKQNKEPATFKAKQ